MEEIVIKIVQWLIKLLNNRLMILFLGIFIGLMISNQRKKYIKTMMKFIDDIFIKVCKHPIEWLLGALIVIIVICQFINPSPTKDYSFDLLNFISSVALAWIMTKYSVKNDFEDRQKETCAISYSYSNTIHNKLKRSIKVCDLTSSKLKICTCSQAQCDLKGNIDRIKDILIGINEDVNQNTKNWASNISEEIDLINNIENQNAIIKGKELRIQTLDESNSDEKKEKIKLENDISKIQDKINVIKEEIKPNIRHMITSTSIEEDPYIRELDDEIAKQEAEVLLKANGIAKKSSVLQPRHQAQKTNEESNQNGLSTEEAK